MFFSFSVPKLPRGLATGQNQSTFQPTRGDVLRGIVISMTCLVAGAFSIPALAQCVHAPIGGAPPFNEPDGQELQAWAEEGDLVLDLKLEAHIDRSRLQLLGIGDRVLAEREAVPVDGYASVRLADVLARGHHPQMRVQVVDELSGEMLIDEPLRIRVDCGSGTCRRQVQRGLEADGAVSDRTLTQAVEDLRATGQDDALAVLFDREPSWRGALAELAGAWKADGIFQGPADQSPVDRPGGGKPDDGVRPDGLGACQCSWVAIEEHSAPVSSGLPVGSIPLHVRQSWNGAQGWWAAQMTERQHTTQVPVRTTELGFKLVCGQFRGMKTRDLDIDGKMERLHLPILSQCSTPCTPSISYDISSGLCISATAYGAPDNSADAALYLESALWIDDSFVASGGLADQLSTEDPEGAAFSRGDGPGAARSVQKSHSSATISLRGGALLGIEGRSSPQPYIFASMRARTKAVIEATCGPATALLSIGTGHHTGGGKMIVRWGDPP